MHAPLKIMVVILILTFLSFLFYLFLSICAHTHVLQIVLRDYLVLFSSSEACLNYVRAHRFMYKVTSNVKSFLVTINFFSIRDPCYDFSIAAYVYVPDI